MEILCIATKAPWPPIDGGRLLVRNTLRALAKAGHRTTLVAPAVGEVEAEPEVGALCWVRARRRPLWAAWARAELGRRSLAVARHDLPRVRHEVARRLDAGRFDVVLVEHLHALSQAEPAFERRLPVVLRAQNVESDLWTALAARHHLGPLLRREARRLQRAESEAVARVAATVALTSEDAARLAELAGGRGRIATVPMPFPAALPAADRALPGEPAFLLLGSGGWLPNRDAGEWCAGSVWPAIHEALGGARLHVFGDPITGPGVTCHPPPADSRDAFAPGAVLLVPLRIGSGVRVKILEAWARGVPVVATSQAAAGLGATDGHELLIADDPAAFAAAGRRLAGEPGLHAALAAAGRARLAAAHDPARVTGELLGVLERAAREP